MLCVVDVLQPALQRFQERNKPEYIQRMAREKLAAEYVVKEPLLKRRRSSLEALEGDISATAMKRLPAIESAHKSKEVLLWHLYYFVIYLFIIN